MECETQESEAGDNKNIWIFTNLKHTCRYRVNQQLIILNLHSVSINEVVAYYAAT